jgi:hypothetical protein
MPEHTLMYFGQSVYPANDTLVLDADQDPIAHGETFTVDDARFEELMAYPVSPTLFKEVSTDYSDKSREELEQMASDAGVLSPNNLDLYPTSASLAAAIELSSDEPVEPVQAVEVAEETVDEPDTSQEEGEQ